MCHASYRGWLVCAAASVAFETAQPLILLSPGVVVALARLALAEHPIMVACVVCGVDMTCVEAVLMPCGVGLLPNAAIVRKVVQRARGLKSPHYSHFFF